MAKSHSDSEIQKNTQGLNVSDSQEMLKEWDYEKNKLSPKEVALNSNKKFWWICAKGHSYDMSPSHKNVGQGCPYCSNRRVLSGYNDLATCNPELLKEWDYDLNTGISPKDFVPGSTKHVHWICSNCGNKWVTDIRHRAYRKTGCPVCSESKRAQSRHELELAKRGPLTDRILLLDFDYEANYPKTPNDFTRSADVMVHWKCHKCGYKWASEVNNRANGRGCPACSNKAVYKGHNDLATTHPELAKEWNYGKNGKLTPSDVTFGYGKKVWWICPVGHEYQASVNKRTSGNGTNCPICAAGSQTSFAEQAVFFYLKKAFPDAINRYHADFLGNMELDIYIPSWRIGIEYDGEAWHKAKHKPREFKKYRLCHEQGIKLIRLKEAPLTEADRGSYDIALHFDNMYEQKTLEAMIFELYTVITHSGFHLPFKIDIEKDKLEIMKYRQILPGESFESLYPDIAKEWHPKKNGSLKPSMFKPGSNHKVWWKCPICGYEYEASIGHRTGGISSSSRSTGCPACSLKKLGKYRCLKIEMLDSETGEVLRRFDSIADAGRELGINASNINSACKGLRRVAGGYKWRYIADKV